MRAVHFYKFLQDLVPTTANNTSAQLLNLVWPHMGVVRVYEEPNKMQRYDRANEGAPNGAPNNVIA
eukprot:SAG31_NODE_5735_length_2352_cov_6.368842_1_plen_66_part_00